MQQSSFELEPSVPESWRDSFLSRKVGYGLLEICCWPGPTLAEAAAFTVALSPLRNDSDWAFPQVAIILPTQAPFADAQEIEAELRHRIDALFATRVPPEQVQRVQALYQKHVRVFALDVHDIEVLVNIVRELPERTALFIGQGEMFSSPAVTRRETHLRAPTPIGEELHFQLLEDVWVPQAHYLAKILTEIAAERMQYVVLRITHYQPERPENLQLLESIDGCNIIAVSQTKGNSLPLPDLEQWTELIRQGRTPEAFAEISARTEWSELNRAFIKAQCLVAAGRGMVAFQCIEPFREEMGNWEDPQLLITVARMALYSGKLKEASAFLASALQQPRRDEETLTAALQLAVALQAKEQAATIRDELVLRYPRSEPAMRHVLGPLLRERRFGEIEAKLAPLLHVVPATGFVRYVYLLARTLQRSPEPDYLQFIEEVRQSGVARQCIAVLDCARDLLVRRAPGHAVDIIASHSWELAFLPDAVDLAMESMQQLLIARRSASNAEDIERHFDKLRRALAVVLRYLSDHPEDSERRVELVRLLAPEGGGFFGFGLLVASVLKERIPPHCGLEALPPKIDVPEDFATSVLLRLLPKPGSMLLLGVGELSLEGIPYSPAELLAMISKMLEHLATRAEDEEDVISIQLMLHIGLLLLRRERRPGGEDLRLMNFAGTGMCYARHYQAARDLAERGLKLVEGAEPSHKRKAWVLFADMYLRTNNRMEALLGLACARQQADAQLSLQGTYTEAILAARLLRDLGHPFHEQAREAVTTARAVLAGTSFEAVNVTHLDTLECTIELQAVLTKFATGDADVGPLLRELGAKLADIIERSAILRDDLIPPMILLAQVISFAANMAFPVETRAQEVLAARLQDLPESMREIVISLSRQKMNALLQGGADWALGKARFAQDLASDLAMQRALASRSLVDAETVGPEQVAFALEWLADHSIRNVDESLEDTAPISREESVASNLLQWASLGSVQADSQVLAQLQDFALREEERYRERAGRRQSRLPESPEKIAQFLVELSKRLDVHMLGLDSKYQLVHLIASKGALTVRREPPSVFSHQIYRNWRQEYPYAYGMMDTSAPDGLSEVERSTAGIGIQAELTNPSLLVIDTELQELPANLLHINHELAGLARPMATTPALSWLRACHFVPRPRTLRRVAWVSTATPSAEELGPLLFLAADIEEICSRAGFMVSNTPEPPSELRGADVAVIGAHGGLHTGERFFQAMSDEAVTRLSGRDVARYTAGAGVAILLVCSGGRIDRDFLSNATIGMPRLLLDYGCRAVVASPWSLQVSVARRWLPKFLEALDKGITVIEATYQANQEVQRQLGSHPSLRLAMHVFGDPLFSLPRAA